MVQVYHGILGYHDGNDCGDDGEYGTLVPECIESAKSNCPTFLHGGTKTW